uniref:Uncharacterized protein n=1 Tax=Rhabditophanes sp. KR3021 TaxID=114890 RepID=A0AC35UHU4_9BILA
MPKIFENVEYFDKDGVKYKNAYEDLKPVRRSMFVPKPLAGRCGGVRYFTKVGGKTNQIKEAFFKDDYDLHGPQNIIHDQIFTGQDKHFYKDEFYLINHFSNTTLDISDQMDPLLDSNIQFEPLIIIPPPILKLKKIIQPKFKQRTYDPLPVNDTLICNEVEDALNLNRIKLTPKYSFSQDDDLIASINKAELRHNQKLESEIEESLYRISESTKESKLTPGSTEFYCSKRRPKASLKKLMQKCNTNY